MKIDNAVGNVQLMQKINRLKVFDCIRQKEPVARPEIAKITGLSPSSITNIVTHLLEKNLVVEVGTVDSKEVGRKATLIKFNPSAMKVISIDIESSNINLALTDLGGEIIKIKEISINRLARDFEIMNLIKREIGFILNESNNVAGIGIAVSGLVQDGEKLVISSSMRWKGLSLKQFFENSFNIPVFVQNNSRTKALWELRNYNNEDERNIIFLDLTLGIGIINFFDHKINEAVIGEFGHTTIKKDGPLCFCGNRGCLEIMCSVDAVVNQCNELLQKGKCKTLEGILNEKNTSISFELILQAYEKGDSEVSEVLKECGEYLGIGLANIINMFNPQRIIINGDLLLTSDFIYKTALEEANKRAYELFLKNLRYEKVNIKIEEALKGVSLFVADKLFDLSGPDF
ncbi:MAG: ROK family transcriptional regulator [Ruminiclostridium sp.]|nr:ROK family transcriptional regulator [Ruminiclostridium sp.]